MKTIIDLTVCLALSNCAAMALGFTIIFLSGDTTADQRRYVVMTKTSGIEFSEYPLWSSRVAFENCNKAVLRGTAQDQKTFCEDGLPGLPKPKLGTVKIGQEVELLDSKECGRMAHVRVLTGNLVGEIGCIPAAALSTIKPAPPSFGPS